MLALELKELCRSLQGRLLIDHLSLQIETGEVFGLLGQDGAGKTTLLDMMSGLIVPNSGTLSVLGYQIPREAHQMQRLLGIVPQGNMLYEELTAWDNLVVYADLAGIPRQKKQFCIDRALTLVQLITYSHMHVRTFSPTLKRRLALACAMLSNPPLIYLDEPTAGIAMCERWAIWDYVHTLRIPKRTIVVTTNSFVEACTLCDRIAIIDAGKLLAIDTPAQFKQLYGQNVLELELLSTSLSISELQATPGVKEISQDHKKLTIIIHDNKKTLPQVIALIARKSEINAIRVRELSLAEILAYPRHQLSAHKEPPSFLQT